MKEKKVNKSIIYITTMILLIVLTLGSIGLAAWAMLKTKLDIGGNVTFNGTGNVLATVSNGKINYKETSGTMTGFTMDENYDESANTNLSTWKNINVEFDEDGNDVPLTFTITNNHPDKTLLVEMTSSYKASDNITMEVLALGQPYEDRVLIAPNKSVEYMLLFSLEDTNRAGVLDNFSVSLNMRNAKEAELPVPTLDKLDFRLLPDDTYEVFAKEGAEGDIVIPAVNNGKKVTKIADEGFRAICTFLIIPEGITTIGEGAFDSADMPSFTIPDSVLTIGDGAFYCCDDATSVVLGKSVQSIGRTAFGECEIMRYINIPASVTSIAEGCFNECYSLSQLEVNEKNQNYCSENNVLYNKDKTLLLSYPGGKRENTFIVPSTVDSIGEMAFYNFSDGLYPNDLQLIIFDKYNGTIEIGIAAFAGVTATVNFSGAVWTCGDESYSDDNPPTSLSALESDSWDTPKVWTITK